MSTKRLAFVSINEELKVEITPISRALTSDVRPKILGNTFGGFYAILPFDNAGVPCSVTPIEIVTHQSGTFDDTAFGYLCLSGDKLFASDICETNCQIVLKSPLVLSNNPDLYLWVKYIANHLKKDEQTYMLSTTPGGFGVRSYEKKDGIHYFKVGEVEPQKPEASETVEGQTPSGGQSFEEELKEAVEDLAKDAADFITKKASEVLKTVGPKLHKVGPMSKAAVSKTHTAMKRVKLGQGDKPSVGFTKVEGLNVLQKFNCKTYEPGDQIEFDEIYLVDAPHLVDFCQECSKPV